MQPEIKEITCPSCSSKKTKKHGTKKKKLQTLQRYFCNDCKKTFTLQPGKNKTYPLNIILNVLSYYNLGHSQTQTSKEISKRFKIKPSQKTISNWLSEYKKICTFSKLRSKAIKLFKPDDIIHKQTLNHIQPYTFKYHKAKLHLLFHNILYNNQFHNIAHFYEPLKNYLEKISTKDFPHHIFTYEKDNSRPDAEIDNKKFNDSIKNNQVNFGVGQNEKAIVSATDVANKNNSIGNSIKNIKATSAGDNSETSTSGPDAGVAQKSDLIVNEGKSINPQNRASQIKFPHLGIKKLQKNNLACKLAKLAINLASSNKERHEAMQNFFLINDSTTIATEIPVYLTNWDAGYYRNQNGFIFPLNNYTTPITGHIDILQIRNGLIHILDYKPDAKTQNPVEQLTIYALALSRKLNLPLYYFKCAWFDENNYFEFFPLHAVYKKT